MLPTVILPGFLEAAIAYRPLEQFLQQLGFPTVTVPLQRQDWFPRLGGRPMTPILLQLHRTVNKQPVSPPLERTLQMSDLVSILKKVHTLRVLGSGSYEKSFL